jgi:hypothetical protein
MDENPYEPPSIPSDEPTRESSKPRPTALEDWMTLAGIIVVLAIGAYLRSIWR